MKRLLTLAACLFGAALIGASTMLILDGRFYELFGLWAFVAVVLALFTVPHLRWPSSGET